MFEGFMVEELIAMVERAEQEAHADASEAALAKIERFPRFSTYVYEWPGLRQMIGVA